MKTIASRSSRYLHVVNVVVFSRQQILLWRDNTDCRAECLPVKKHTEAKAKPPGEIYCCFDARLCTTALP